MVGIMNIRSYDVPKYHEDMCQMAVSVNVRRRSKLSLVHYTVHHFPAALENV